MQVAIANCVYNRKKKQQQKAVSTSTRNDNDSEGDFEATLADNCLTRKMCTHTHSNRNEMK